MIRDEVVVVGSDGSSHERFSGSTALTADEGKGKGAHGHDRKKGDNSRQEDKANVFTGIIDFFAGLGKNKNKPAAASDADRTPLTAYESELGEESELHDNLGPLLDPRWSIYPPVAGVKQRRGVSQPVAIKRAPGTRARAPRLPEPADGSSGNGEADGQGEREEEGDGEQAGDDAESKIKAWQRRRMSAKRESFTVRTHARTPRKKANKE